MMLKAVIYGYMNNLYSCRKIASALSKTDCDATFMRMKEDAMNNGQTKLCPMGQRMNRIGTTKTKTESGYVTESARYKAQRCQGCPLRGSCFKASGDRIIEVNHRLREYRRKARERLTSEEGIKHRGRRCIEPEAVFGQMKYDMAYKRFRHFGLDKVTMDFAFFAIAFNLKKMCSIMVKSAKMGEIAPPQARFCISVDFLSPENRIFRKNREILVA